ncbi:RDD family protein [Salininema proteolyticum]|uniref:RDD family protein n=1 Tax=Salininema proteolyticum TaxID=1607685 RepID=A0ABV8U1S7_9ACTN
MSSSSTPLASVSARFVHVVIDWLLCLVPIKILQYTGALDVLPNISLGGVTAGPSAYTAVLFWIYTAVMLTASTRTFGMKWMGIECISAEDSRPIGFGRALLRAILTSLVLPAVPALFDQYGRGLHDRAAGSVMVQAVKDS